MEITACNRLDGTVTEMQPGKATTHLRVRTRRHGDFEVVITSSSVEEMALRVGDDVVLMFREADVILMRGEATVSAVNRFTGRVLAIKKGTVTAELPLDVNGDRIVAVVARSAAEKMQLTIGDAITGFVREIDVLVVKGRQVSARNRIEGTVASLRPGTVTVEVTIELDGGRSLLALVARSVAEEMKLAVGHRVTGVVREGDVMVAKE